MKKLLMIAIALLAVGLSFAQTTNGYFTTDTVVVGNQAMIRVSMCNYTYEDSMELPYPGASFDKAWRIAKTTKVLEVWKKSEIVRNHLFEYFDVYRYNTITHKWKKDKDQKTVIHPDLSKEAFAFYFIWWLIIIVLYWIFSAVTKRLFGKIMIASLLFSLPVILCKLGLFTIILGWGFYVTSIGLLAIIYFIEKKRIEKF